MASIIRIKRSSVSGNPATLGAGELAYSALTDNGSNGGDRLYIGIGTETSGNAANHFVIGGKFFTDLLDHTAGTLTASSALIVDASSKINNINVGNLTLTGSTNTVSSTDTNGNIVLTPNGTGKLVLNNPYINGTTDTLAEFIYDTVGGAVTAGTGITITNADVGNTSTVAIDSTVATLTGTQTLTNKTISGGSNTLTNIANGSLTNSSITVGSTSISLGATSTSLAGLTAITFAGSTSGTTQVLSTAIAGTSVLTLPAATDTLVGKATTDTLTNKTISGSTNTLTNIANGSLTNSSVTIGSTSVSLGATVTTFAGLASVTSTAFVGALTGNASTATTLATPRAINGVNFDGSAAITVTAAAGTLSGSTLASGVTASSLTSVGTITSGTWNGTTIAVGSGGTGTTSGSITGTGALTFTAGGSNTNVNLVPIGTGIVDVGGKRVGNAADPTQSTDLATKAYVDSLSNGLDVKASVRAATTANITLSNTQTVDGVALSVGDRVLVKDQSTGSQNGIYVVASGSWTRATDFDNSPGLEVSPGTFFFVEEGTTQADNGYVVSNNTAITIDTTAITFSQFSGAGQITAGAGLTKSGNTLDVVGTTNRITVATDSVDIASTYVGQTSLTTLGTITTGVWNGTVIGATYGGTGVNNGASTITLGGSLSTIGAFTTALTATGNTAVTLPTSGTLATLAGSETFTNKTLTTPTINGAALSGTFSGAHTKSGIVTFSSATASSSTSTGAVVISAGGLGVAGAIFVGTNITGAGAATSTLDGFNIDGGTY